MKSSMQWLKVYQKIRYETLLKLTTEKILPA